MNEAGGREKRIQSLWIYYLDIVGDRNMGQWYFRRF